MPNYCNNNIVITGPNSVIDKIEKIANGDKGDLLQYFYPMPKELNDTVAGPEPKTKKEKLEKRRLQVEYGASNWYDWRVENWGTKWNSYDFELDDESKSKLQVRFLTAWCPPKEIFIALRNYCNEHNLALGWEYMQEEDGYEKTYQLDQEC